MSDLPVLEPAEQRILGALMEKQTTVPSTYPLSANALRSACNQTSSREPVVDYDQEYVEQTARALKERGLLRIVWSDTGRRTLKYHQTLDEHLGLGPAERGLLTVLLLRGMQSAGELFTRTERLHAFADRGEVEATLRRMAERQPSLVRELERRAGQKDRRWIHLLEAPADIIEPAVTTPLPDVLAQGVAARDAKVRMSYDAVAASYADRFGGELPDLPFETWLLDRVAAHAGGRPVVDVGCGPGHITAYLAAAGADASGVDLSAAMVDEARQRFPGVTFEVADLRRLTRPKNAGGWAAVVAWYSLIHLADSELPEAIAALTRPLDPGGWLVLAMQAGSGVRHNDEWLGHEIDLTLVLRDPAYVVGAVEAAGLVDVEWYLRGPRGVLGESTQRLYVVARSPR